MTELCYTEDHEWVKIEGDEAVIGITDHAQDQLGDIVFIELPEIGRTMQIGDEVAVIESVKAASEIYAPIDGEVVSVNDKLTEKPDLVNKDPEGDSWLFRLRLANPNQIETLMDKDAYQKFVTENS